MKITSMEEYGLRCMLQLAIFAGDGPVPVTVVAEQEGLSTEYAGKLLNLLRQAELVDSIRGRNGGFVLSRPADEISVAEILRVFSPELFDDDYCNRHTGIAETCVHNTSCSLRPVWWTLSILISRTLESLTLMDLMNGEAEVQRELLPRLESVPEGRRSLIQISEGVGSS